MVVELMPERWSGWPPPLASSPASSPRISLSGDGAESPVSGGAAKSSDGSLLHSSSSSPEFHFCVSGDRFDQDSSVADELFSDGFLLPLPPLPPPPPLPPGRPSSSVLPYVSNNTRPPAAAQPPTSPEAGKGAAAGLKQSSSFWKFSRSSSLNCGGGGGGGGGGGRRASMICSLPLLSRSKSAGPHPTPSTLKRRHLPITSSSPVAAAVSGGGSLSRKGSGSGAGGSRNPYFYGHHGGAGAGGIRIGPVLNLPPAYIPKGNGGGIFSLGRLLCSGRARSRKKTPPPATP